MAKITMTHDEWIAEATRRFGDDPMAWRFVCPSCGHVASAQDWINAGAPKETIAFSCVGRWTGATAELGERPGPCNYTGGGLFRLNPVIVEYNGTGQSTFAFAEAQPSPEPQP